MFGLSSRQKHWLDFLLAMTEKEIKARYKFAVLGFFWIVLNPILQMLVVGLIFRYFVPISVENYFVFLLVGLLVWNFFSYTISKNTPMILNERGLIHKANFPRETIVLSIVFANLFHTLVGFFLLYGFAIAFLGISLMGILFFMLGLLLISALTVGLSLLFSALNVKYRDTNFAVQAILPLWFYATPIVYTRELLPENVRWLIALNPLTTILEIFQFAFLNKVFFSIYEVFYTIFFIAIILVLGWQFFIKEAPYFDDWV